MTLHRRMKSLRSAAQRPLAVAVVSSLLAGVVALALPAPHVHADEELVQQMQQQLAEQADTIISGGDVAADDAVSGDTTSGEASSDGTSAGTSDEASSTDAVMSDDADGQTAADGGQSADGQSSDAAAAADDAAGDDQSADTGEQLLTLHRENLTRGAGYDAPEYLKQYQIKVHDYSTTQPERSQYPFKNAFDGNWDTTYMAVGTPQQGVYTINFEEVETLSRILYRHFSSNQQPGFPTHFKISVSETGEEGSYREIIDQTTPDNQRPTGPVTFTLSEPVKAKSIKFETLKSPGGMVAAEFKFLRHDAVADEVDHLFTDDARTQLAEQYNSKEALDALQTKIEQHPSKESMLGYIERARMILDGTWTINSVFTRKTITAGAGADSEGFLKEYQVPVVESSTDNPGSKDNELAKAFDGNWDTRYRATNGGAATVTVKLKEETQVHRIIYASGENRVYGYPSKLTIGFSDTGREGSFREVPCQFGETGDKVIFTLSEPIKATYLRFNFGDSIGGGFYNFRHCAAEIKILKFDQVEYDVSNLFEDPTTQYKLKDQYNNEEWLTALQQRVDAHPNKDDFTKDMARAWAVYRGQVIDQNDRFDWPVHVIQKTGDDSNRAVWVFFAEGYRADEMDKFIEDITERANDMLAMEPFRSMASYINMYAYCAESNESGYSSPGDDRDTFFKSYWSKQTVNGGVNQGRAKLARDWITANYLDEGGTIMHSTAIINTNDYFGQGNGTSAASLAAGYKMTVHEGSHMFATLVDHYTFANIIRADNGGTNQTVNGDWKTIRWHEFLGHRGTGISGSDGKFNPTNDCLMDNYYGSKFCEVCREAIFRAINDRIKTGKNPMYVAQPEITISRTDEEKAKGIGTGDDKVDKAGTAAEWQSGPVVDESNITSANGRQLQYRTVVSNYLDTNQDVTLSLTITGADGTVKTTKQQTFSVHPNTQNSVEGLYPTLGSTPVASFDIRMAGAVSLTLVTDTLTDLAEGDKIDAKVTYNGELMGTDATISYGTARISYKLVDDSGNEIGDMPEIGTQENRVLAGTNNLSEPPTVYGYTYVKSNIDEKAWRAKDGETTDIVRYYRQTSAQVTRVLVDANGLEVSRKSERVASGTQITPAKSDFTVAEGYVIETPAAVTVGSDDLTLTYTVRKGSDLVNAALGSTVKAYNPDGSAGFERPTRPMKIAVDGVHTDLNSYADFGATNNADSNRSYAEFDLGGTYELEPVTDETVGAYTARLWRYYGDKRTYNATVIVASEKGTFAEGDRTVLYNSDAQNIHGFGNGTDALYAESEQGLIVNAGAGTKASKVRIYMRSSNKGGTNHIIEFELMGRKLDLTYNTELEQAIAELSKKVESGLYTTQSTVAARAAIENARRKLINGADVEATMALKTQLEAAEKKLRVKDTSDGSIEFLGGSLRYSDEVQSSLDGLRVGFGFTVPKGATVVWEKTGWQYGLTADVSSGFQSVEKYVAKNGEYVANLVLTNIPADRYDMILYTRARLTYVKDGEETTLDADVVNSRSVEGVADRIMASTGATDDERALARTILAG